MSHLLDGARSSLTLSREPSGKTSDLRSIQPKVKVAAVESVDGPNLSGEVRSILQLENLISDPRTQNFGRRIFFCKKLFYHFFALFYFF